MVRVYNSFMNREEIYPWATFTEAWQGTTTNPSTSNLLIEISILNQ